MVYWASKSGLSQDLSEQDPEEWRNNPSLGGFVVSRGDDTGGANAEFKLGRAIYPTVEFAVIGHSIKESDPEFTGFGLGQSAAPNEYRNLTNSERLTLLDGVYRPAFNSLRARD